MQVTLDSSRLNDWKWSWFPIITTPAIFMANGFSFLTFLLSDERYEYNETILIQVYVTLSVITLITAVYLFFIRLDHLAGLVTAVFSSNFVFILITYQNMEPGYNTPHKHPFECMGIALAIWSIIACLLNVSPGVVRVSRKAFFRSNSDENRKIKIVLILGVIFVSIPVFTFSFRFIEQITLSRTVKTFLRIEFWLFYLPVVFIVLLGIAWAIGRPYPEEALKISTWAKALMTIYFLNFLSLLFSLAAIYAHNDF